ncbi:MAG: efflux RND transporter periplasmic adaptor subunit [Arenicellales bacterium]
MINTDKSVRELNRLKLKIRSDVSISARTDGAERTFLIEDSIGGKFYRVGESEYRFISLLDGSATIGEILIQLARDLGEAALTEQDAAVIVNWLSESRLLQPESGIEADQIIDARSSRDSNRFLRWLNPLFIKIPLCNPDRFLEWCKPLSRILYSPTAFIIWCVIVVSGLYQVVVNASRFSTEASGVLAVSNWALLLIVWIVLKVIHELSHGLVCKHFGGSVNEAGVIMILLVPIGYVNATSSWGFSSRWRRIYTAVAGIYVEFFIAAVAAWVWVGSEPGLLRAVCYNTIVIASINTLLFNANPLMKFDGYYVFSDLVKIPNLYLEGVSYVKYLARRYLLGLPIRFTGRSAREDIVIRVYGVLSLIWRILVIATLLIAASALFHGLGLVMAFLALCVIVVLPGLKFLRYLVSGNQYEKPRAFRFVTMISVVALIIYFGLFSFKWNQSIAAHGLVEFSSIKEYRTIYPGEIRAILVEDGEEVSAGQRLVDLSNPELVVQVATKRNELEKIRLERKELLRQNKLAAYQATKERETAARRQLLEFEQMLAGLELTAESEGVVILNNPDLLVGRYVRNSDVLLSIAHSLEKELRIALPQRDVSRLQLQEDDRFRFLLLGGDAIEAEIQTISPSATDLLVNPVLTAVGGGPLAVLSEDSNRFRMTEPHFWIIASIINSTRDVLGAGERGLAVLQGVPTSIGYLWIRSVKDWIEGITNQIKR